jgi:hypothetical protein
LGGVIVDDAAQAVNKPSICRCLIELKGLRLLGGKQILDRNVVSEMIDVGWDRKIRY